MFSFSSGLLGEIGELEKLPFIIDEVLYIMHERLYEMFDPVKQNFDEILHLKPFLYCDIIA